MKFLTTFLLTLAVLKVLAVCVVGTLAALLRWEWLDKKCEEALTDL